MSMIHLLWIVPFCVFIGILIAALLGANDDHRF